MAEKKTTKPAAKQADGESGELRLVPPALGR